MSPVANALGWLGSSPTAFDRGAGFNALQRDGVYGTGFSDFQLDLPLPFTQYSITALLGDPGFAQTGMYVESLIGTVVASGISTPAGQSTSVTFTVTSDASGSVKVRFGTNTTGTNAFWTLQDLEARPIVGAGAGAQLGVALNGTAYTGPGAATLAASVPANGTTSTLYSITGATKNSLLTITASLGTIAPGTDVGGTSTGIQVLADNTGAFSRK